MPERVLVRPGGRSERIQRTVHSAVNALKAENPGTEITIAQIAARANVPPSTIYRRWGNLANLLSAVAEQRWLTDPDVPDTGSLRSDLSLWLTHFVDDISSGPGRVLLEERVANVVLARKAAGYAFANLDVICRRAEKRGEKAPDPNWLMDFVVAPVIYRILFVGDAVTKPYQAKIVEFIVGGLVELSGIHPLPSLGKLVEYPIDP